MFQPYFSKPFLEDAARILDITSVFPGIPLQLITNIEVRVNEEELQFHSGVSNVFTPIATPDVFISYEAMFLEEERISISGFISDFSVASLDCVLTTRTTAAEGHLVVYEMVMVDFLVNEESHAITTLGIVFTEE